MVSFPYDPLTSNTVFEIISTIQKGKSDFKSLQESVGGKKGTISPLLYTLSSSEIIGVEPSEEDKRVKKYSLVKSGMTRLFVDYLNRIEPLEDKQKNLIMSCTTFENTLFETVMRLIRNNRKKKWKTIHEIFNSFSIYHVARMYRNAGVEEGISSIEKTPSNEGNALKEFNNSEEMQIANIIFLTHVRHENIGGHLTFL